MAFRPGAAAILVLVLVLVLAACDSAPAPSSDGPSRQVPGIAAVYDGGEISLQAVEANLATSRTPRCSDARRSTGGGTMETLIPCYREIAEALALEAIVLADEPGRDVDSSELTEQLLSQRKTALVDAYLNQLSSDLTVTEKEVARYFNDNQNSLGRSRQFTMFNIFRRHRDPEHPEQTAAFLADLKSRIEAGETFTAIARRYSDSETRLRDGVAGHLFQDQLPARLQQVTARLNRGEISEPLMVNSGGVLIKIENISPAVEPDLVRQHDLIVQRLVEGKVNATVDQRIANQPLPKNAVLVSEQDLIKVLDAGDSQQLVFSLGDQDLSAKEFRRLVGLSGSGKASAMSDANRQAVWKLYQNLNRRQMLATTLLNSQEPEDRDLREQVDAFLQKEHLTRRIDRTLRADIRATVDQNPDNLERYYRDNLHHYQTPLRFELEIWHLPLGPSPGRQMAAMESMRREMLAEKVNLTEAAEQIGGTIQILGWRDFSQLDDLPEKAHSYLLQAAPGGYSVPYQQDQALHMIGVKARQLPRQLSYEDVSVQVREDYFARFERRLFLDVVAVRLKSARFQFNPDSVQAYLAPPERSRDSAPDKDGPG